MPWLHYGEASGLLSTYSEYDLFYIDADATELDVETTKYPQYPG